MNNFLQHKKPVVWTISGSDSGGGAGVQADLYSFQDFAVHGCSVISALTAQNSFTVGYTVATERKNIVAQINALDSDLPAKAIKLGMLLNEEVITTVAKYIADYSGYVVCDPHLMTASGDCLLADGAGALLRQHIIPRADVLSLNITEAQALSGSTITQADDMVTVAAQLLKQGARSVILTGGHFEDYSELCLDYWSDGEQSYWLQGEYIDTVNDHGSGCSFSAAITAALARGFSLQDALVLAKAYVSQGLRYAVQIGSGPGPVGHFGWPGDLDDLPVLATQLPTLGLSFPACDDTLQLCPVVTRLQQLPELLDSELVSVLRLRIEGDDAWVSEAIDQCRQQQVQVIIEGDWQRAIDEQAYGVHLELEQLSDEVLIALHEAKLMLGVAVHSYADIATADGVEPSYMELHVAAGEEGWAQLEQWVGLLADFYPLVAVSVADAKQINQCMMAGVDGVVVMAQQLLAEDSSITL
ncbi:bifunctional hydroxymethylpyrimidine kinase/phosphomethylpyrimidine kinase [Dasania marina]|uniref:bifunctional hydroxymethylpyrimidine kinase/phosphomethylpyrimidine kinase n=1 Tax=Dasania marina TaxID=471499 RepID=UPI0003687FBE|nr:bifunctional hydroxymethylpyrimidine kinase/phosphomethylpyrimidine kinase [Dasania marina]